jgi:radical SAM protein with 4Fe4S-binding SPASM domain
MLCEQDIGKGTREFFERFYSKVNLNRIPVSGCIELTARCNLNCVHCYMSSALRKGEGKTSELPAGRWMDLIDQMADAGCLFLLFTGGEVLLRPDFTDIYIHACQKGLLTTVFTNATRISDRIIEAFAVYPPRSIEITLYGATAPTYEKITGIAGSFDKCMQGIYTLKENGFRFSLKTMLLNVNFHELAAMESFAADLGARFRFDAMIAPRLDGDPAPLAFRVSPEQAVANDFANRKRARELCDFFHRMNKRKGSTDLYVCGAGLNMFYIDSAGRMRPCLMVNFTDYDTAGDRFEEIWRSDAFKVFNKGKQSPSPCGECDAKILCGYCPGFFRLESGSEQVPSEYLCAIGRERKRAIVNENMEDENG